jgi:predicted flap endonuclease-1-like 5' DNA nuclease
MTDLSDERINQLYQKLPQTQPSKMTDARIRRAIRQNAPKPARVSKFSIGPRWQWMGSAAVLLLCVGVIFRVAEQAPSESSPVDMIRSMPPKPATESLAKHEPELTSDAENNFAEALNTVPLMEKKSQAVLPPRTKSLAMARSQASVDDIAHIAGIGEVGSVLDACRQQTGDDMNFYTENQHIQALRQMEKEGRTTLESVVWNEQVKTQTSALRQIGRSQLADCLDEAMIIKPEALQE